MEIICLFQKKTTTRWNERKIQETEIEEQQEQIIIKKDEKEHNSEKKSKLFNSD